MLTDKEQEEIRRKLLALEEEPPADGWNKIAAEIRPPRKPRPVWWLWSGVLLLLLGTFGIYKLADKNKQLTIVAKENLAVNQGATKTETIVEDQGKVDQNAGSTKRKSSENQTPEKAETQQNEVKNYSYDNADLAEVGRLEKRSLSSGKAGSPVHTDRTGKPIIPIVVSPEKPKRKHDQEQLNRGSRKVTSEPALTIVPNDGKRQTIAEPETIVTKDELNTSTFIVGRTPDLRNSNEFILPDSVYVALLPDSIVKAVTVADTSKLQKSKEWYLGVTFAPRYAFRSFTPMAADDIYITKLNNYKKLDPKRLGYEFGLNVGKKISPNLYLESALTLMQLQENVSYAFTNGKVDTLIKSRTKDGSFQAKPVYIEGSRQLESTFTYGGLRVGLSYYFLESSRSRFNLTFAGGANLLLKGRTREYLNGDLKQTSAFPDEENVLEQTNYNLLVGAGYNLTIRNNYELMLMPSLNYFLGSTFSKHEPFGLNPYTLGLSVQLRRRFIN